MIKHTQIRVTSRAMRAAGYSGTIRQFAAAQLNTEIRDMDCTIASIQEYVYPQNSSRPERVELSVWLDVHEKPRQTPEEILDNAESDEACFW